MVELLNFGSCSFLNWLILKIHCNDPFLDWRIELTPPIQSNQASVGPDSEKCIILTDGLDQTTNFARECLMQKQLRYYVFLVTTLYIEIETPQDKSHLHTIARSLFLSKVTTGMCTIDLCSLQAKQSSPPIGLD